MKLRFEKNSLRLRLRRSDISALRGGQAVTETVGFGGSALHYTLVTRETGGIAATFADGRITVYLPLAAAQTWMDTDQVGMAGQQDIGHGQQLDILIEKDFPCKDRPEEDASDTFSELAGGDGNAC